MHISSVVSLLVLKFARFLFIFVLFSKLCGVPSVRSKKGLVFRARSLKVLSLINTPGRPALALCLVPGPPRRPRGLAWGATWGSACPPRGLFGEMGLGRGGGGDRAYHRQKMHILLGAP
jgi:hypothetical protein